MTWCINTLLCPVCWGGWWNPALTVHTVRQTWLSVNVYSVTITGWLMYKLIPNLSEGPRNLHGGGGGRKTSHKWTFVSWKSERKVIANQEERVKQPLPFILVWGTYLLGKQDLKRHSPPPSVTNIWVSVVLDWVSREKKGLAWLAQIEKYDHTVKTQALHSLHNRKRCTQVGAPSETFSLGGVHDGQARFQNWNASIATAMKK